MYQAAVKTLLLTTGCAFLAVGALHLFAPHHGVAPLGMRLTSVSSVGEVRANYGGMHLAFGVFLLMAALRSRLQPSGLVVVALFTGGLAGGRSLSLLLDGSPGSFVWALFLAEAAAFTAAAVLIAYGPNKALEPTRQSRAAQG